MCWSGDNVCYKRFTPQSMHQINGCMYTVMHAIKPFQRVLSDENAYSFRPSILSTGTDL